MLVITRVRRTQTRKMPTGPEVRPRPRTPEKFSPDSDLHWILEGKRAFCFRSRYGQTHPITHLQKDSNYSLAKGFQFTPKVHVSKEEPSHISSSSLPFPCQSSNYMAPNQAQMQITVWSLTSHVFGGKSPNFLQFSQL